MAKPQIQSRVDDHVKSDVVEYAEEGDMTEAAAVRHLVQRGLDAERGQLVADGGVVQEQMEQLKETQQRQNTISNVLNLTLIGSVVFLTLFVNGTLSPVQAIGGGSALAIVLGAVVWYSSRVNNE